MKSASETNILKVFSQKIIENDSIQVMPQSELVELVDEFYSNYPLTKKKPELERKLQEGLISRIKSMKIKEIINIIESLTVKSRYSAYIQPALISDLMDLVLINKSLIDIHDLKVISRLITNMVELRNYNEKNFEALLKEFSAEYIENLKNDDFCLLCDVLSKIGMQNKYFDVKIGEKISVYKIIEEKLEKDIHSLSVENLFKVLKCLVINDRGNEDLIREAEKIVFGHAKLLEDRGLSDVPFFYQKRILYPSDYLIYNVYKPVYNEFTRRYEKVNPLSKSLFLVNYWKNSTFHGMYCDNLLSEKIKKEINSGVYDKLPNSKLKQHMYTICLSYMAHARQLDPITIENYINIVKRYKSTFDEYFFMRSAIYLSRYQGINPEFWEIFSSKFKNLSKNPKYYEQLYSVWLNCKLKDPSSKEILNPLFTDSFVKSLEEKWVIARKKDIVQGNGSHKHNEAIRVLRNFNVKFAAEYYDQYYIDLALPEYKIGIEISGPGHFLFPSLILNGRSESKRLNMEKLGWKIHVYPYFYRPEDNEGIVEFLNDIIPLDFK